MKTIKNIHLIFACIGLIGLSGCGKKQKPLHRFRPLHALRPTLNFQQRKQDVSVSIRILNTKDCVKLFGRAGRRLVAKTRHPFAPLHITITNNSDHTYMLRPDAIDLPLANTRSVSSRLKPNITMKTIGTVIGGAVLTGLVASTGAGLLIAGATFASAPLIVSGITTCVSSAAIFLIGTPIASAVRGVKVANERKAIGNDVAQKTLVHDVKIEPNTTVDTLVFVRLRKLKKEFDLTLENRKSSDEHISFDVKLK